MVAELSPPGRFPSIELEPNVEVNSPDGAELNVSLWVALSFSMSISSLKLSLKYRGKTWEIESSGPSDPWLPFEECDNASDIMLEVKVEDSRGAKYKKFLPRGPQAAWLLRLIEIENPTIVAVYLCIFFSLISSTKQPVSG
ncbi:hypothetical protein L873DRAFT_1792620 [Choiromyces venosus 120613-1]|uniref:Uncharacterized protein n=1 Tax=Choiromyces venosus 120613-1 TaxID=1336337 RepID=A0A3N4JCY2_9PEZI|nr:hypothetical protein L873DRAFT_1792620 [Choiromyces venosus 120613-1]